MLTGLTDLLSNTYSRMVQGRPDNQRSTEPTAAELDRTS